MNTEYLLENGTKWDKCDTYIKKYINHIRVN